MYTSESQDNTDDKKDLRGQSMVIYKEASIFRCVLSNGGKEVFDGT